MVRRRMRTFLAVTVSAAVALIWAGTATAGAQTVQPADTPAAVPGAGASPTISATSQLSERRYVAAGTQAYVVGVEDGTFPPIGWHTTGQMGGVFTPPVKLLDGLWFGPCVHDPHLRPGNTPNRARCIRSGQTAPVTGKGAVNAR